MVWEGEVRGIDREIEEGVTKNGRGGRRWCPQFRLEIIFTCTVKLPVQIVLSNVKFVLPIPAVLIQIL